MAGLIHIYCGDGKGKTTAATGLAVRAAGAKKKVIFAQFMKDGSSSEIGMLKELHGVEIFVCSTCYGFFQNMDEKQKIVACRSYSELFERVKERVRQDADVLVLDEAMAACKCCAIKEADLIEFLKGKPEALEVVLTGREPSQEIVALADYVSEIKKVKHPYDYGVKARHGIEF